MVDKPTHTTLLSLTLSLALSACGPATTNQDTPPTGQDSGLTGLDLAAQGFGEDPYVIASDWYDYSGATHVVMASDLVYIARQQDTIVAFEIESYYNERGTSGFLSFRHQTWREGAWSAPSTWTAQTNVKEESYCLSLAPFAQVECDDEDAALVVRTSKKALIEGGFAILDPALFTRTHFTDDARIDMWRVDAPDLESLELSGATLDDDAITPSSDHTIEHARVGWIHDAAGASVRRDTQLHVTGRMDLVQWRASALRDSGDTIELDLELYCAQVDQKNQQPFGSNSTTWTLTIPRQDDYTARYVRLCDDARAAEPEVVGETSAPIRADWPDTKTFDLMVETHQGRVAIRIAPGNLLWNWTRGTQQDNSDFSPIDTSTLWDGYVDR